MFTDVKQKSVKINTKNHKIKYGFLNNTKNNSLFLNIASWVELKGEIGEYNYLKEFNLINKNIKKHLLTKLDPNIFDDKNFIVDVNIRQNGLVPKMKSYFDCEITLFKRSGFFNPDSALKKEIEDLINLIIKSELKNSEIFTFRVKK